MRREASVHPPKSFPLPKEDAQEARLPASVVRIADDGRWQRLRRGVSARRLLTTSQAVFLLAGLLAMAAALVLMGLTFAAALVSALQLAYAAVVVGKLWICRRSSEGGVEFEVTREEIAALGDAQLPVYSVLVPLHRESEVVRDLVQNLSALDYPKDRLDVLLLLEADDEATVRAVEAVGLPPFIRPVLLRPSDPRTKPKALDEGLLRARGEFVVIYDAEDAPDADQLRKAVAVFRRAGEEIACVQARLSYYNRHQNILTRLFTAEYAMWFGLLLPGLQALDLPIPLGGTSNHFRHATLTELGGWDPYNVTEDADLGIRLYRAGLRTAIMNSTTLEEANSEFVNWVRQRSRWVKGYMQTYLVHMRRPGALWHDLGGRGFWAFQAVIGGGPFTFLMAPLSMAMTILWLLTSWHVIARLTPPGIYYLAMLNLLLGNFTFAYMNMVAVARMAMWDLVGVTLVAPVYWAMMSLGAMKAALQLFLRPAHWEKTIHGLARESARSRVNAKGTTQVETSRTL